MGNKVGVVILTYNRLNTLKITVCKVLAQTYNLAEVLIVDNNSSDGTQDYLVDQEGLTKIYLKENLGPAGGFYQGIKYFAEKTQVDYVWLMDDDFFPLNSCLEMLMKKSNPGKVVYPFVREKNFVSRRTPAWWGVLIPMPIVHDVGYPREDFFFWSEDTEYLQARIIHKFKYPCEWISAAKGVHFTVRKTGYRRPWQYYYEGRNSTYARLYIKKRTALRMFKMFRSWFKLGGIIVFKEDKKFHKMKWLLEGIHNGISGKLGKRRELHMD